ncbi:phasin family protein [Streptococcus constellatus subsp. pharyngis]|uniref:Phasin family protein n=1 Tax=Streptococcus constellatus subsp. pharyngis SK1060 = CCUG 46377 TaxID=1035184 RepID=F9P9S1_STRCV|nr:MULTISPECIES: hypothetical protein [Streptococcus anginosus group]AGU71997.1 hypothetical protein SCRE_0112 [Streptococcus constellatus subsp. pharyngis C232]AGU73753.1 hypothetical protein SCR2_0112 [Streptococcus constellatus subsp. pharyngis C818]AGU79121.1 hypothetical protein SCI_0132 [Streptococcus constellatus subsp. pharyngis C1050]EGV06933.1 hypothetical protein HMPREF1042_2421 [Streptococcus constellatus subsp. pharyngis SK1060 = CCUG 46377]QQC22316.1 hypothetical protein I6H72_05
MDELKKVLLAGIGLTSMTYDKSSEFVKELIAKGRLTVDEGKQLQSELKRKAKEQTAESQVEHIDNVYATKQDIERLEDKLDQLLKGLSKTEE